METYKEKQALFLCFFKFGPKPMKTCAFELSGRPGKSPATTFTFLFKFKHMEQRQQKNGGTVQRRARISLFMSASTNRFIETSHLFLES